ncbi:MAG: DUF3325 domain-containing protein [Rhizobacter sp.]
MSAQLPLAVAALCASFSGFSALSLAMDRHWEDSFGRGSEPGTWRRWLRVAGVAGLVLSLIASLALKGNAQGWVVWLGAMTAAALVVVLVLSYAPKHASRAAIGATIATALAGVLALVLG